MAVYTWATEKSNFVCSLNDPPVTIADQIRILIGDVNAIPVPFLSDGQIEFIAINHGNDVYAAAAECCDSCASRVLQIQEEIQQGMRFKIKNFDPVKAYAAFLALASVLRNKSTIGTLPSYGALEGTAIITPTCPNRWGL